LLVPCQQITLEEVVMAQREPYKGYVLTADPIRRAGQWSARVVLERHGGHGVNYQPVADDPASLVNRWREILEVDSI
jgi:hypothetical protein